MTTWVITETEISDFDVSRDKRAFRYGVDFETAQRAIRKDRRYDPKDKVYLVDGTGYRTKVKL